MYTKGLSIPLLLFLSLNTAMAKEISVWLTEISDGDKKDLEYGSWVDDTYYDVHQDEAFTLLKRTAPIRLRNRPIGHEWRIILTPTKRRQVIKGLGVTLQNEPQCDTAAYPCMRMTSDDQIELVRRLGEKFKVHGITTRIFVVWTD